MSQYITEVLIHIPFYVDMHIMSISNWEMKVISINFKLEVFTIKVYYRFSFFDFQTCNILKYAGYHGNAGDSLNDNWYGSNLKPFSTFDKYDLHTFLTIIIYHKMLSKI